MHLNYIVITKKQTHRKKLLETVIVIGSSFEMLYVKYLLLNLVSDIMRNGCLSMKSCIF